MHRIALMFETGLNTREASKKKQIYPPTPPKKKMSRCFSSFKKRVEFIQRPSREFSLPKSSPIFAGARGQKLITSEFSQRQSSRKLKNHQPPTSSYHIINLPHLDSPATSRIRSTSFSRQKITSKRNHTTTNRPCRSTLLGARLTDGRMVSSILSIA